MNVLVEGHRYELDNFEIESNYQLLQFIQKEPIRDGRPELRTITDGTTNEEVLSVLINRMEYLDNKIPCQENKEVLVHLREALSLLEKRTKDRLLRNVEGTYQP